MDAQRSMMLPGVSVVVPVYNSADSLGGLVDDLERVLSALDRPFEVVLVNDGSQDRSWSVIQQLCQRHAFVRGICLMRNFGQHNALLCGIRAARHEVIVTMDDDGQNPPREIPKLLERLEAGCDVIYGSPARRQHGLMRNLGSWMVRQAVRLAMGTPAARHVSAFRAIRTPVREAFASFRSPAVSIDVLLSWGTTRFGVVRVEHDERRQGRSNYNLRRLASLAFTMITGFSTVPLQLASWIGFGLTLFGVAALLYVVVQYFRAGGSVPGFPFLASIISIFSGAQLFALGVIGEYLARMHWRLMDRPAYAVRETCAVREACGAAVNSD
ncbi:MAG TPA: glycosyltransferase family 2 protein [Phycisphaeraceae bacterium]